MLSVKIVCGLFILMVVLTDVVLPQCQPATPTGIHLDLFGRIRGSNQITLRCRWCNFSDVESPHLFVNSTDTPIQFRLENGLLAFNISQEMEGHYYCGASPNNIGSNNVTLIAYPVPRSSIPTQHSVEEGQTITVDCPIAVGALRQRYTFLWRKDFQTLVTTGPGTQYSVDPLNKSLTIVNVQLDNNGTYYCDVTVSVPGVNKYYVPEEYTRVTLFVTEQQPTPSAITPTLKPSPPDRPITLIPLSTLPNGITTGAFPGGSPSMTPIPSSQQPTMEPLDNKIVVTIIVGVTVPVLIVAVSGCVIIIVIIIVRLKFRNKGSTAQGKPEKADKKKEAPNRIEEPSENKKQQEDVPENKKQQEDVPENKKQQEDVPENKKQQEDVPENKKQQEDVPENKKQQEDVPEKAGTGKKTPEYRTFQKTYDKISSTLVNQVPPNDLANKLYAAGFIGENFKRQANRNSDEAERINKLLTAVHNQIELNSTAFHKFIEILEGYSQLKKLVNSMKLLLSAWKGKRNQVDGGSDDEEDQEELLLSAWKGKRNQVDGGSDDEEDQEGYDRILMVTSL